MSCIDVILRNSRIPGDGYVLNRPVVGAIMPKKYRMRTLYQDVADGPHLFGGSRDIHSPPVTMPRL